MWGGVHGASRDIDPPAGVTFARQISDNSVEPTIASRSRNLFSHDDSGPAGGDEAKEVGPQMPRIVCTGSFAGDRERLARAGAGPDFTVVGPSGEAGGVGPSADAGEEMALGVSSQVFGPDIHDAPLVHVAVGDQPGRDQVAQPLRGVGVKLVVVRPWHLLTHDGQPISR